MNARILSLLLSVASPVSAQEVNDEPQWIYREIEGSEGAAAVFLSWDYRSVVMRAVCEKEEGRLRIEYFGGDVVNPEPISLIIDGAVLPITVSMETSGSPRGLIGHLPATGDLADRLISAGHLQLDAPNEMGEPWHLNRAEPLRRVARQCATGQG